MRNFGALKGTAIKQCGINLLIFYSQLYNYGNHFKRNSGKKERS